ncbi:MAG: hypothetical protein K9G11_03180 [Rickettsiaceae bacterium]|nr:hypothetical protein [Rickettsiaceae bacterium]
MTGITCLCGYGLQKNFTKAFVIIANQFAPPSQDLYTIIDDFISLRLNEG